MAYNNRHLFSHSFCGSSGHLWLSWSSGSVSLVSVWSRRWLGLQWPQGSTREELTSELGHVAVGRIGFLVAVRIRALVPCLVGLSIGQLIIWQLALSEWVHEKSQRLSKMRVKGLCYLKLEMTTYCFCCILFIRSEIRSLAHTPGEGITEEHGYQETGTTENQVSSCLPHRWRNQETESHGPGLGPHG